jgi:hypothetical protein
MDEADRDDGEQPDDEHRRGQQERSRRIALAAQVEQRDDGEDGEADR